jgi:hypothetical protein
VRRRHHATFINKSDNEVRTFFLKVLWQVLANWAITFFDMNDDCQIAYTDNPMNKK